MFCVTSLLWLCDFTCSQHFSFFCAVRHQMKFDQMIQRLRYVEDRSFLPSVCVCEHVIGVCVYVCVFQFHSLFLTFSV